MELENSNKLEIYHGEGVKQDTVAQNARNLLLDGHKAEANTFAHRNHCDRSETQDFEMTEVDDRMVKMIDQADNDDSKDNKLKQATLKLNGLTLNNEDINDSTNGDEKPADINANDHSSLQDGETAEQEEEGQKKKKKKKTKSASGHKKPPKVKPTGFEDYYVDPPIAPAEYLEEQSLYSSEKTFADRFLLAVARYTSRRKFNELRLKVFDKYLAYGGLSTGIKQFQGRVDEKTSDMTATDIAIENSKYHIEDETLDASVVDIDAVVRGFLSSYLHSVQELLQAEDVKISTGVIRNFLNYLLYHDVCPEHADQIYDAKKSCDDAEHQLPICSKLATDLPGTFNQACSLIFGGFFQDTYIEDVEQAKSFKLDPSMPMEEAVKIFLAGLAAHGTQEMVEAYNAQAKDETISIVNKQSLYLEVVSTHPPSAEALELYSFASQSAIRPTGMVKLQTWRHPHGPWPEMSPTELRAYKLAPYERHQHELCLDIDLLPLMLVGTKICCTCYETSFGLRYFDSIIGVLSPMFTWLNNEAMMDWIKPRELLWKPRSAHADDGDVIVTRTTNGEDHDLDTKPRQDAADDENDDVPSEFKKYDKGEDIIVMV